MKKFVLALAVLCALMFSASLQARGIGAYGGYVFMQDEYADKDVCNYDDTWTVGVLFDMGSFLFNSLIFRPAVDYVECDNPEHDFNDKEVDRDEELDYSKLVEGLEFPEDGC